MYVSKTVTDRPTRPVAWLPKLLLIVASVAIALVFGEIVLRSTGRYQPLPYPPPKSVRLEFENYEPYGYRLIPSRRTTYLYPPHNPRSLSLASNRDGFRSIHELDEPDARPRALFLGDSLVYGDGVEESERFTNVLETLNPAWRMDNLGMVGYGPDLMLRALEVVGLKLKPAVVVFCMYTNDFYRVHPDYAGVGFPIPRYKLESGHLVSMPYPKPAFWERFSLSVAAERILWNDPNWQWDLNQVILDRFEELGDRHSFRKVIIFLPGTADTPGDRKRRSWLKDYASRHTTPFLDLSDPIHKMGKEAFIENNGHPGPSGHRVVARELDRFLRERHLLSD